MGSTTPTYGLPFPDGSDLVIAGDDAMQALAARVAVLLTPAYAFALPPGSPAQTGITGGVPATFTGIDSTSGEFTLENNNAIRYTGPNRWFLVDVEMLGSRPGNTDGMAAAALYHEGVEIARDRASFLMSSGTQAQQGMLRITTPCYLWTGSALQVLVSGGGSLGASFYDKGFRIASIGAPE